VQQRRIGTVADQRMAEHELGAVGADEEVLDQHAALVGRVLDEMAQGLERVALAEDGGRLQGHLVDGAEPVHARVDQRLDRSGKAGLRCFTGVEQQLQQEQRIALGVFDCLHDMGDPVGVASHVRSRLATDGTWLIVEPFANDRLEDNLNPVGRVFYSASTFICTPASRSQEVGLCLGAQAGEARIRNVCEQGGFRRFRRARQTPFNLIYEARP
jgi:hypothetical protein